MTANDSSDRLIAVAVEGVLDFLGEPARNHIASAGYPMVARSSQSRYAALGVVTAGAWYARRRLLG